MKAIGYIKMVDLEKGFGFITTSTFEGENRRSIDVYFRLNRWQNETVAPEFAMPVVFTRDRINDRETAKNIKPLLCKASHIKLALQQSAQKGRIALYDPNIRKPVLKDVAQEIFERMDNGARDIVRDSLLAVILEARDGEREGLVEAWSKNAFVRLSLMNIFSGSCEGCDQGALAIVRRVLGIKLVNNIRRSLFPEQREFMSYLSLDKYNLRELIVELKGGVVEEMRRPDFSKIKRYKYGARGSVLQRKEGMIPIQCKWESLTGYAGDGYYTFEWQFTNRNSSDICEIEVAPDSDLVKITAKEIVSRLYKSNMNMEAGAAEKLSSLHDTLDKQLQEAGDDVFVYELLQNANDYPNGDEDVDAEFRVLRYKEGGGCLNFRHTGAVFSARNVAAICSANDQDKSDNLKAIGYKGIGFKTVFRFNDRAEVRSGEFGFAFDRKTQEIKDGVPWRTTPCWVYPKVRDGYRVDIRLVPHDAEKLGDGPESYCHQLKNLFEDAKPLLFIPHLRCVKLYLDDWEHPIIRMAKSENWCVSKQYVENVTSAIRGKINDALKDDEHCRIPPKYRNLEKTAVSFACRRSGKRLLREQGTCLYCYLPAKEAKWGLPFLMNTDMIPNGPRNNIEYADEVRPINKYFAEVAGRKCFAWIAGLIRSCEYLYDSIYELIPDFEECIAKHADNEKTVELIEAFRDAFNERIGELPVPADDGTLFELKDIVRDKTGLSAVFPAEFARIAGEKYGHLENEELRKSKAFQRLCERYLDSLHLVTFDYKDIDERAKTPEFIDWMNSGDNGKRVFEHLFKDTSSISAFGDLGLKPILKASMIRYDSDLGAYEFASKCTILKSRFWDMPVEDWQGHIKKRDSRSTAVFFYDETLIDILEQPWTIAEDIIVLSRKYDAYKALFAGLSVSKFEYSQFFAAKWKQVLKLDSIENVNAFHRYVQPHVGEIVNVLKLTNVVVRRGNAISIEPWSPTFYIKDDESMSASYQAVINSCSFIESELGMEEYWIQRLGNRRLGGHEIIKARVSQYLSNTAKATIEDSIAFVHEMAEIPIEEWDEKYGSLLQSLSARLYLWTSESDCTAKVKNMRFGSKYVPRCDYQRFGLPSIYVSDAYAEGCNLDKVKCFLSKLGVEDRLILPDIKRYCPSNLEFCKYLWKDYLPSCCNPFSDTWKPHFNCKCLISKAGEVCAPDDLYSETLTSRIGKLPNWDARIMDSSFLGEAARSFISKLPLRNELTFEDAIDYLGKANANKVEALISIARPRFLTEAQHQKVLQYRAAGNQDWVNGCGERRSIVDLVAISASRSENARSFSGLPGVMKTRKILGKSEDWEPALRNLGVRLIDDSDLVEGFEEFQKPSDIPQKVLPGLLVYSACRENDDWFEYFKTLKQKLNDCEFIPCKRITLAYGDMILSDRRVVKKKEMVEKKEKKILYYVGDMQGKRVFESIARAILEWLDIKGEIEELKDYLDADVDLSEILVEKCQGVLKDDAFCQTLKKVDERLFNKVLAKVKNTYDGKGMQADAEKQTVQEGEAEAEEVIPAKQEDERNKGDEGEKDTRRERLEHKYGNLEDEDYALLKLIDSGLTVDEAQDQSKIACIRLFRYLEREGLKPSMYGSSNPEFVIKTLYSESRDRKGPNIDISNGKTIHVISAMGGIMHLPPKWWNSMTEQFDGTKEICIMYGAREGEFKFIREHDDIQKLVADNAILVKVNGVDAQERMDLMSAMFGDNRVSTAYGKVYGLIKMRSLGEVLDRAFINKILETTDEESRRDEPFSLNEYD